MIGLLAASLVGCDPRPSTETDTPEPHLPLTPELLAPPEALWQADYLTVPRDRGLQWEIDPDFVLKDFTVPQVFLREDNTWGLLVTNMYDPEGRWIASSEDGLTWATPTEALLEPEDFTLDCGNRLEDAFVVVEPDGRYRMVLDASLLTRPEDGFTEWRRWCQAVSDDGGHTFEPLDEYLYTGNENDDGRASVPHGLVLNDWSLLVYYVGDLYHAETRGGIRAVRVFPETGEIEDVATENVLPDMDVDPMPTYLEGGGGLRLYHTHGPGGGAGLADTTDAIGFTGDRQLLDNGPVDCITIGGVCYVDPTVMRLPDDRLVMYFTIFIDDGPGTPLNAGIHRAFATD